MENPLYLAVPITRLRIPSARRTLAVNFSALAGNVPCRDTRPELG
jgi:hypothetical protein